MKKSALLVLCITHTMHGAAPVVHAYFAELYFKHCKPSYTQKQRDAFLRGTLFPDIRYIASIDRTITHKKEVSLASVIDTNNPFTAGLLFHTYVDEQRERIAQSVHIYEHLTEIPSQHKATILKVIEDEFTYHKITPKSTLNTLRTFDREEGNYGVSIFIRMLWHRLLRGYFKQSPLTLLKNRVQGRSGYFFFSANKVKSVYDCMVRYVHDSKVCTYVDKLMKDFEALLINHKGISN